MGIWHKVGKWREVEINREMGLARTDDHSAPRTETIGSLYTRFFSKGAVSLRCLKETKAFRAEVAVLST